MAEKLFGTDGIRGIVGRPPITPDVLVKLGFVTGQVLAARADKGNAAAAVPTVLIAKDTRQSGYMMESAFEAGLSAAGVDVLLTGPLPTSAVSYLTVALRLSAGIVISASHNPYTDNGIKFFAHDGYKFPDAIEQQIQTRYDSCGSINFGGTTGKAKRLDDAAARYIEFCKRAYPSHLNLRGVRLVVDCANGAAYHVAPHVFHELGADVLAMGDAPDGMNINVACGALAPAAAVAKQKETAADCAVILDGDADRVLLVDEQGTLHNGDAILYLLAKHRRAATSRDEAGSAGIVGTILSNLALEEALRDLGVDFYRANVGDRYVLAEMLARGWRLGGEPSGHIVLRDFHNTGDGIIAALAVLAMAQTTGKPLSELLRGFAIYPQATKNLAVDNARAAVAVAQEQIVAAQKEWAKKSVRIVVRPSGTEPLVRLMAEAKDPAQAAAAITALTPLFK